MSPSPDNSGRTSVVDVVFLVPSGFSITRLDHFLHNSCSSLSLWPCSSPEQFYRRLEESALQKVAVLPAVDYIASAEEFSDAVPLVYGSARDLEHCRNLGAAEYCCYPLSWEELGFRIRYVVQTVQRGRQLYLEGGSLVSGKDLLQLTDQEFRLMKLFISAGSSVVTSSVIARKIWGAGCEAMVSVLISRFRRRLNADWSGAAFEIRTVRGKGYRLVQGHGNRCQMNKKRLEDEVKA